MSCGKDAEHCKQIAAGQGAPEAMAVWAEGRGAGGHCPECGGFLTTEGVCNNPHTFSMSLAGGAILGVVDTTDTTEIMGVCPDCGATLSVAPGEEDWCMQCEELVTAPLSGTTEALRQLKDDDSEVRVSAVWALGDIGDPVAIPALEKALDGDKGYIVRWFAADALGKIGDPVAIPALEKALKDDKDSTVRRYAADALGKIGDPVAIPALEKALKDDKDSTVRRYAAQALGNAHAGDPLVIPTLEKALTEDDDPIVRRYAADALGEIGEPAIPALKRLLAKTDGYGDTYNVAVNILSKIGGDGVASILTQGLAHDDWLVQEYVAQTLGAIGDSVAGPALIEALGDKDSHRVRESAAQALGAIGDPAAVPALERALRNDTPPVRWNAAVALGAIGDKAAIPALEKALGDTDHYVYEAAQESINKIKASE